MRFHLTDSSAGTLNKKTGIVEFSAAPAYIPKPATTPLPKQAFSPPSPAKHELSFEAFVMNASAEIYAARRGEQKFSTVDNTNPLSADAIYAERRRHTYRAAGKTA